MAKSITKEIHEVAHYINHVVDFEESNLRSKFSVRAGIDSKLDKSKWISKIFQILGCKL